MTKSIAKYLLALFLISIIYFITRFTNLLSIPVFCDEAIYLRWSQIIKSVETLRFIPLTDGKQPLFMWLTASLLKFFTNPLSAGRFLSVVIGFLSMISLSFTFLIYKNFDSKSKSIFEYFIESIKKYWFISLIPSIIYLLLPFAFFFDRLSLPDNLLSFLGIFSFLITLLLIKFPRLDISLILGTILGLAWITKSPAVYFIIICLSCFFVLGNKKLFHLPLISSIIAFLIYNLLRLGPQFQQLALRNKDYIWSPFEIIKHPLDPLWPHLQDLIRLYIQYLSIPLLVLMFFGLVFSLINKQKLSLKFVSLLFCYFFPLIANLAFSRIFTGRYFIFTNPFLIIIISLAIINFYKYSLEYFQSKILLISFIVICFLPNLFWIYKISTNPFSIKLPLSESGYTESWTSGWGIEEVSKYLIARSKTHNVIVGTEGYFGTLPDGLQIYTNQIPNLTVFGVEPASSLIPEKLTEAKNYGDDVYLLTNSTKGHLTIASLEKLKIIIQFTKPDNTSLILYQLL
jgi:4-amino-4-deoxy-L-arabinose transferase-like glycosyltransferase